MKVATSEEIKRIDRRAIEKYGIPGTVLMENAGRSVVLSMIDRYGNLKGKRVSIVAGKGNNGGDGFVIARYLHNFNVKVDVFLTSRSSEIKGDARINLNILKRSGIPLCEKFSLKELDIYLKHSDIIVDAIFGTGLSSEVKKPFSDVINLINCSGKPVVSVDIPSGISSDAGEVLGIAVKADLTVTFVIPKRGILLFPGAEYAGVVKVADIGIPAKVIEEEDIRCNLLTREEIRSLLPERRPDSHKGLFGHLLVIAGSVGKTGAAVMTGLSALRVGSGLVTIATPASLNNILEAKLTEVMTFPLPETDVQSIALSAENILIKLMPMMSAIAIGPGLSVHPETVRLVRRLITKSERPMVIDADALNSLAGYLDILKRSKVPLILTPHPGEMARLIGKTSKDVQKDRIRIAHDFAMKHRVYLVLKGARTVFSDPDGNIYINTSGNPGMATAGTGDVLTGIIAGLISQGIDPLSALKSGVHIHGLAGDLSAEELGDMGMIACDIIERIPRVIKSLKSDG
jgi:NAD(P)H-hydrate epimerase